MKGDEENVEESTRSECVDSKLCQKKTHWLMSDALRATTTLRPSTMADTRRCSAYFLGAFDHVDGWQSAFVFLPFATRNASGKCVLLGALCVYVCAPPAALRFACRVAAAALLKY